MLFYIRRDNKGIDATAEFDHNSGAFIVLKGSRVSNTISDAPTFRGAKSIRLQREMYVKDNVVQDNVSFKSSSTAGNFVTGGSTDGPRSWRTKDGETLKSIMSKAKE